MRGIAIALLLGLAWGAAGCRRKPPPPPPRPPVTETPEQAVRAAKAAVVEYLTHLEQGDYRAAYALLTVESHARHPYPEFAREAKAGGPLYNKNGATAKLEGEGRARVSFPHEEDPASTTFAAAREAGRWRVVYHTGRPWTPGPP